MGVSKLTRILQTISIIDDDEKTAPTKTRSSGKKQTVKDMKFDDATDAAGYDELFDN